jgi:uncharacterized protein YggU (UPF0235/DUF167 family)
VQVTVRAVPNARRTLVGGRYGEADPPVLVVRVTAPATDGRANRAVSDALAAAFGVRRTNVKLLAGARGRLKTFEVDCADRATLEDLLEAPV